MSYPKVGHRGVLCLEGAWEEDLRDRSSVLPTLQLLESLGYLSFIHRTASTREALFDYLRRARWAGRYDHYQVLQIACHGEQGQLWLSKGESVELGELAEALREVTDRRRVAAVYFGSCLTMAVTDDQLAEFCRVSRVRHVLGFTEEVDWLESAAFETLVLGAVTGSRRVGDGINTLQRGPAGELAAALGFRRFSA